MKEFLTPRHNINVAVVIMSGMWRGELNIKVSSRMFILPKERRKDGNEIS